MFRVVKLGGSLHDSPELAGWLRMLAYAGGRIVVVPGGGPYADTVRAAQMRVGISDAAAHHMALLAMDQYALMLCDLQPNLVPAASTQEIAKAIAHGLTPIWLPSKMSLKAPDIPRNWSVTSDSLSAWLAHHLGAEALALVKYENPGIDDLSILADGGWIDMAFTDYARIFGKPVNIIGQDEVCRFVEWLSFPVDQALQT